MRKWQWNGYTTYAASYAAARRNIQWQAFGRLCCPARDAVDPQMMDKSHKED